MENNSENAIGERIKKALFDHKMNHTEFANRMGVRKQTVSLMINGSANISTKFIYTLAKECPRTDMRWILTGEKSEIALQVNEDCGNYYNPLKEKDKQIEELHRMIKTLIEKIHMSDPSPVNQQQPPPFPDTSHKKK